MKRAGRILRKIALSLGLSGGLLALTNLRTVSPESDVPPGYVARRALARRDLAARPPAAPARPSKRSNVATELRRSLGDIELGAVNPWGQLRDLDPLEALLTKGVVHFKRQSYRSPRHQAETGYDLVSFEITHDDRTTSTVLAYLERTLEGGAEVPVVLIVASGPERAAQTLYRAGELVSRQTVPLSVAQATVGQRLNGGVPFLSVSR